MARRTCAVQFARRRRTLNAAVFILFAFLICTDAVFIDGKGNPNRAKKMKSSSLSEYIQAALLGGGSRLEPYKTKVAKKAKKFQSVSHGFSIHKDDFKASPASKKKLKPTESSKKITKKKKLNTKKKVSRKPKPSPSASILVSPKPSQKISKPKKYQRKTSADKKLGKVVTVKPSSGPKAVSGRNYKKEVSNDDKKASRKYIYRTKIVPMAGFL